MAPTASGNVAGFAKVSVSELRQIGFHDFVVEKVSRYLSNGSERYMTQATAQASVTSQTIAVEHIRSRQDDRL